MIISVLGYLSARPNVVVEFCVDFEHAGIANQSNEYILDSYKGSLEV